MTEVDARTGVAVPDSRRPFIAQTLLCNTVPGELGALGTPQQIPAVVTALRDDNHVDLNITVADTIVPRQNVPRQGPHNPTGSWSFHADDAENYQRSVPELRRDAGELRNDIVALSKRIDLLEKTVVSLVRRIPGAAPAIMLTMLTLFALLCAGTVNAQVTTGGVGETPTAPTQAPTTSNDTVATTRYVQEQLTGSAAAQAPNTFFAGPSTGLAASPTFRFMQGIDLPAPFTSGTISGNTSEFGTVSGGLTSTHCLQADSQGNIIDAGAACGTSSGGITALTGPVTAVGPGSAATTITAGAVTSSNLASGAAASNIGALGGSLSGTLPNPSIAAGAVGSSNLASGAAAANIGSLGGDLSGTLPSPTLGKINGFAGITTGGTQGQVLTKNSSSNGDASWRDACLNIESFSGVGNDFTDSATPLNNALSALSGNGGCIFFPPGKYKFNSAISYSIPSGIFSVTIVGAGMDSTILTWPAAGGITFTYAGIHMGICR